MRHATRRMRPLGALASAAVLAVGPLGCADEEPAPATTVGGPRTVVATTPQTTTVTLAGPESTTARTVEGQVEQSATVVPVVTFAGRRGESLGDLAVQEPAELRWTCPQSCETFTVQSAEGDDPRLAVEDSGSSGRADVARGSYTAVRVRADDAWTLTLEAKDDGS